jgi:hypothetical protein
VTSVALLTGLQAVTNRCTRKDVKQGWRGHDRYRYRVVAGKGSNAGVVCCRACATPAQMEGIRKAEKRR